MPLIHTLTLPSGPKAARKFRAAFAPAMESVSLTVSERDKFLLAMSEIITNLAQHSDPQPELVRVTLRQMHAHWQLSISDDGSPFLNFQEIIDEPPKEMPDLRENGMGLYLISNQFVEFSYTPKTDPMGKWNELILNLPVVSPIDSKPSIIIVDDDPVFIQVIASYLKENFHVSSFLTADAALTHLRDSPVDLVISDIRMPGTDGYVFRQKLQNTRLMDTVPFIFLTGEQSQTERYESSNLSIDDYLTKPIKKQQLITTIKRVMKRAEDLRNRINDRLDSTITDALVPGFQSNPEGFEVVLVHEAASAGGGDVLIERKLDNGHLIILADIMGHGEQAKFFAHALTGYAYGAIKALTRHASPPEQLLNELSELFLTDPLLIQSCATAMALVLYPDGTIFYTTAGHPPPILLSSSKIVELESTGPLLGLMEDPDYQANKLRIELDERLILLTDGISEAGRTMITQPMDLFSCPVEDLTNMTNQQIAEDILSNAQVRSNYLLYDDATAVVISRSQ